MPPELALKVKETIPGCNAMEPVTSSVKSKPHRSFADIYVQSLL